MLKNSQIASLVKLTSFELLLQPHQNLPSVTVLLRHHLTISLKHHLMTLAGSSPEHPVQLGSGANVAYQTI